MSIPTPHVEEQATTLPATESVFLPEQKAILIARAIKPAISQNSKRAYSSHLAHFIDWINSTHLKFSRETVLDYRDWLLQEGKSSATVNLALSAIRALATEAKWDKMIPADVADAVLGVKGVRRQKQKTGNWLTKAEAEAFMNAPDSSTPKGKRDRVMLGLLVGCGLRRTEVVAVTNGHVQQRDGRWCIVDLKGKGGRFRTVQMRVGSRH
jgi:integrase/recombinase XerD